MKLQLRKRLSLLALSVSLCTGVYAATQTDIENWTRNASAGDVSSQYNLGLAYLKGEGVAKNFTEASKWFQMAANNGEPKSMYFVGRFVERNPMESEKWMLKSAQQGYKEAQQALVSYYKDGAAEPAVPRNPEKAKYWQDVVDGKVKATSSASMNLAQPQQTEVSKPSTTLGEITNSKYVAQSGNARDQYKQQDKYLSEIYTTINYINKYLSEGKIISGVPNTECKIETYILQCSESASRGETQIISLKDVQSIQQDEFGISITCYSNIACTNRNGYISEKIYFTNIKDSYVEPTRRAFQHLLELVIKKYGRNEPKKDPFGLNIKNQ